MNTSEFVLPMQILSADGSQEVGKITKQWSGLAKEYFTDADNFGIQCEHTTILCSVVCMYSWHHVNLIVPMDLDVKMKATMLAACFLIVSSITQIYYYYYYYYYYYGHVSLSTHTGFHVL